MLFYHKKAIFTKKKKAVKLISFTDKFKFGAADYISLVSPVSFGKIHSFKDREHRVSFEHLNNYYVTISELIEKIEK